MRKETLLAPIEIRGIISKEDNNQYAIVDTNSSIKSFLKTGDQLEYETDGALETVSFYEQTSSFSKAYPEAEQELKDLVGRTVKCSMTINASLIDFIQNHVSVETLLDLNNTLNEHGFNLHDCHFYSQSIDSKGGTSLMQLRKENDACFIRYNYQIEEVDSKEITIYEKVEVFYKDGESYFEAEWSEDLQESFSDESEDPYTRFLEQKYLEMLDEEVRDE